jgi:hypothetical protein
LSGKGSVSYLNRFLATQPITIIPIRGGIVITFNTAGTVNELKQRNLLKLCPLNNPKQIPTIPAVITTNASAPTCSPIE